MSRPDAALTIDDHLRELRGLGAAIAAIGVGIERQQDACLRVHEAVQALGTRVFTVALEVEELLRERRDAA